jgi:hypothetical protein
MSTMESRSEATTEDDRPDAAGNDTRPAGVGPRSSNKYRTNRSASSRHRSFLTRMGESFKRYVRLLLDVRFLSRPRRVISHGFTTVYAVKPILRSGGERGADVQTIRGTRGAEFEGIAQVLRGESGMIECGCFGGKHENDDKLLLVKGTFCFVFYSHDDLAPKYAISLTELKAVVQDSGDDRAVVTLESSREVEYEMSFQDLTVAKAFRDAVAKQSALGRAEVAAKVRGFDYFPF